LLRGTADNGLEAVAARDSGIIIPGDAKGAATLDWDADARPDALILQNDDEPLALRNESPRSWLALRLVTARGTPAIGARTTVHFADGRVAVAELAAGSGYLSQSSAEIYLGADQPAPVRADIRWPGGETQSIDLTGRTGRMIVTP
jgi:hypothetical protein